LILVLRRERPRALKVFRGAVNVKPDAGEGIVQPLLDQGNSKVRDVNSGPLTAQLLRRVYGRPAAAERV